VASFAFVVIADDVTAYDFSAERIVKSGKKIVTAHVNAKDDRWRFEFAQMNMNRWRTFSALC
jgi:hypothetical protein